MDGSIVAYVNGSADYSRFGITPVAAGNRGSVLLQYKLEAVALQQGTQSCARYIRHQYHRGSERRDLLHDNAHEIVNDRLTQQLLFTRLSEHQG